MTAGVAVDSNRGDETDQIASQNKKPQSGQERRKAFTVIPDDTLALSGHKSVEARLLGAVS